MNTAEIQLINKFYSAFQRLDAEGMNSCYHQDILFYDPVFLNLNSTEVKNMWQMLCQSAKDFKVTFENVIADDGYGSCTWEASYIFSGTGRRVINHVRSKFRFRDGLIIEHLDDFDLWKWSRQAFGAKGILLGWTPPVKNKIRGAAKRKLEHYIRKTSSDDLQNSP